MEPNDALTSSADTPTRLLDATERLVAERGVDAVSLRAINGAAGANVAAIHYHFGSKADLLRAVLERRSGDLALERRRRLDTVGPDADVRSLVEVAVAPFLELARTEDGASWAGFLAALERAGEPWVALTRETIGPQWQPTTEALGRAMPELDEEALRFRLAAIGAIVTGPALDPDAPDVDSIVDLATAVFLAPVAAATT